MNIAYAAVAVLAVGIAAGWVGNSMGYDRGVLETTAAHDAAQVENLGAQIAEHTVAINASNSASRDMRLALNRLAATEKSTTTELKNALAKNAADPVLCRFDDDSMRIIAASRERAAHAAASGVRSTVPAAGDSGG